MKIEVIFSKRRKKTLSAHLDGSKLIIRAPSNISHRKLKKSVEVFRELFKTKELNRKNTLKKRADKLNRKYFKGKIQFKEIKFVVNQQRIWGSCSSKRKTIRISSRLLNVPDWVLNYVLIHELVHLIEPNHSKRFWEMVNLYKLAERAKGYLIALGGK